MSVLPRPVQQDAPAALQVRELSVHYDEHLALDHVSVDIIGGTLTGIAGPNGAGKSTLLKATLGLIPYTGEVRFFDARYERGDPRVVYVPQRRSIDWDFPVTVEDVVRQGRYHHVGLLRRFSSEDHDKVEAAMKRSGVLALRSRQIGELSGGQQQRVFLARALSQGGELFILDEPFTGIDATTEEALLHLLRELRDEGKTLIVVHHDLGTVRHRFEHLVLLNQRVVAAGLTDQVFTPTYLQATFGDQFTILDESTVGHV